MMHLTDDVKVDLVDLFPELAMRVPGLSRTLAKKWLMQTYTEFCRKSNAWRILVSDGEMVDANNRITPDLPDEAEPAGFIYCFDSDGEEIKGDQYTLISPRIIEFHEGAEVDGGVSVIRSLLPTSGTTTLPKTLFENFGSAICYGAAAELVSVPSYEWHNPQNFTLYRSRFEEGISDAMRYATNNYRTIADNSRLNRKRPFF